MQIYVVEGIEDGEIRNVLVTTNLEKAKSKIVDNYWGIQVWENDSFLYNIQYSEELGFVIVRDE